MVLIIYLEDPRLFEIIVVRYFIYRLDHLSLVEQLVSVLRHNILEEAVICALRLKLSVHDLESVGDSVVLALKRTEGR